MYIIYKAHFCKICTLFFLYLLMYCTRTANSLTYTQVLKITRTYKNTHKKYCKIPCIMLYSLSCSNIQFKVQEIREQLEILKQSSQMSGWMAASGFDSICRYFSSKFWFLSCFLKRRLSTFPLHTLPFCPLSASHPFFVSTFYFLSSFLLCKIICVILIHYSSDSFQASHIRSLMCWFYLTHNLNLSANKHSSYGLSVLYSLLSYLLHSLSVCLLCILFTVCYSFFSLVFFALCYIK